MIKQINPSRFGVIIVDMQPYFLMVVEEPERLSLIQKQIELLQICKKKGLSGSSFRVWRKRTYCTRISQHN